MPQENLQNAQVNQAAPASQDVVLRTPPASPDREARRIAAGPPPVIRLNFIARDQDLLGRQVNNQINPERIANVARMLNFDHGLENVFAANARQRLPSLIVNISDDSDNDEEAGMPPRRRSRLQQRR